MTRVAPLRLPPITAFDVPHKLAATCNKANCVGTKGTAAAASRIRYGILLSSIASVNLLFPALLIRMHALIENAHCYNMLAK